MEDDQDINSIDEHEGIDKPYTKTCKFFECPLENDMRSNELTHEDITMKEEYNIDKSNNDESTPEDNSEDDLQQLDAIDYLDRSSGLKRFRCGDVSKYSVVPDEEIEAMLDEGLADEFKCKKKNRGERIPYEEKQKLVLDEIGHSHFDVLPVGWIQVTHNSGMPLYLHKRSRSITFTKPYFIGSGSVCEHGVPLTTVPCLHYKLLLEEEEKKMKKPQNRELFDNTHTLPNAQFETIQDNFAAQTLDCEQLRSYCRKLFRFKTTKVVRLQRSSAGKKLMEDIKNRKQLERPTLPEDTKLISLPIGRDIGSESRSLDVGKKNITPRISKNWIMNPSGKSYVYVLHEYVQHVSKQQPTYKFKELKNTATPYLATVCVNDKEYGSGVGRSRRQAKSNAARKALEVLIPQMSDKISGELTDQAANCVRTVDSLGSNCDVDLSFFDEISITDPRVADLCTKIAEPLPYVILTICLQRSFGRGYMHIECSMTKFSHQRHKLTMRVGEYEETVMCKNKKDGKQLAAQAILQRLHPQIQTWGLLLRLYGSHSVKWIKERKQLELELAILQGKSAETQPNYAILDKLRQEMLKLPQKRKAVDKLMLPHLYTDQMNKSSKSTHDDSYTKENKDDKRNNDEPISDNHNDDLPQYVLLDDLGRHSDQEKSRCDVDDDSMNSGVPDKKMEAMLDTGRANEFKCQKKDSGDCMPYEEEEKLVLDEIGDNNFKVLPEEWVQVIHDSGIPLYLHEPSRSITLTKPYSIGSGSARKHQVPLSAIPCLYYARFLEEKGKEKKQESFGVDNFTKIEAIQENLAVQKLDIEQLRSYCQKLFRFKTINFKRFRTWSDRRKFMRNYKNRKQSKRSALPDDTKLLSFPIGRDIKSESRNPGVSGENVDHCPPNHWILNPSGKSYMCILQEYAQRVFKKQPTYKFEDLENGSTLFPVIVCINNMEYGRGFGSNKKKAKINAARKAVEILIPQMRDKSHSNADMSFFDEMSITDPRVAEFCAETGESSPHAILITCIQRNFGLNEIDIKYSINILEDQSTEFTIRVGKHEATVVSENKKDGKQRAAQAILQHLYPHFQSWGSLLRLYGSPVKSYKEKKPFKQEITPFQGRAPVNPPNNDLLAKLREEMRKLQKESKASQ